RIGRRTIWSSKDSISSDSPGANCKRSRTGLGRTTRPARSILNLAFIMVLYHAIYHIPMPLSLQRLENLYREPLLLLLGKPKPELFRQESVLAAVRYGCRSRKLTKAGPKDAVQIALDDVALEHRNDPKVCPGTGRRAGFFA